MTTTPTSNVGELSIIPEWSWSILPIILLGLSMPIKFSNLYYCASTAGKELPMHFGVLLFLAAGSTAATSNILASCTNCLMFRTAGMGCLTLILHRRSQSKKGQELAEWCFESTKTPLLHWEEQHSWACHSDSHNNACLTTWFADGRQSHWLASYVDHTLAVCHFENAASAVVVKDNMFALLCIFSDV